MQNNTPDAERGTETAEHSADRQATNAVASRRAGSLTRWLYRLQTPAALRLGGDDEERRRAEVELRKRSDDLVGEALLAMRLLPRTRPSQVLELAGVFVLTWIVGALAVWTVDRRVGADFSIWTAVGPSMASVLAAVAARGRQRELAANWLAVQKDPRVIGPLADAMDIVSRQDRARVAAGLAEALEQCRREDYVRVVSRQRRRIGEALLTESDETVLSLLRSLVRLGDGEARPYVERLATGEGRAAGSEVVQAASDALPELREAARLHEAEQTLLRPAMPAESQMLLRPAVAGPKSPAGTLVRPVEGDEQVSHGEGTGSNLRTRT